MAEEVELQGRGEGAIQHIRLACQACQRKKIKCDRTFPCGQCLRSSLVCEASTRKPRVRHAGKRAVDSELRNRITKLESLVESLSGEVGLVDKDAVAHPKTPDAATTPGSPVVENGSPFWSTLTNEVQALRDALEEDGSDDEAASSPGAQNGSERTNEHSLTHDLMICPPGAIYVIPGALPEPPPLMAGELYKLYLTNVDPVFKLLHRSTVEAFLYRDMPYFGRPAGSPPNRALKTAMWFAAVTTLRDDECAARFSATRSELLRLYRRHCDAALTLADVMVTTDLATLQAFVVYVAASRITDSSRRPWTMTGLIMRLAQGLSLHHENTSHTPFEQEMRRRLWHQIRVLDAFAASDRGTEVLIPLASFTTALPNNVDDDDFDENSPYIPDREKGMSDMTFNLMAHLATRVTMQLLAPEHTPDGKTWQQRLELARDLGNELREKYLQFCDLSKPFHRFIHAVGTSMAASSMLRAVRPLQKHVSSIPPRVDSPLVLELAVNSLRASEATHEDPEAGKWRWMVWVQWHALAVALAGLCSVRDTPLAKTAWLYVEKAYDRHSKQVADSRNGKLWRPVEKLYRKASAFRDGISEDSATKTHKKSTSLSKAPQPEVDVSNLSLNNVTMPDTIASRQGYLVNPQPLQMQGHNITTTGSLNAEMDMQWPAMPSQGADLQWMDWENIMQEISTVPGGMDLNEFDMPSNLDLIQNTNVLPEPREWSFSHQQNML
ncbi:C6 finger domain transcription factor adaR [Pseudocercospora fuligena]|uniref:C6 finger domain transcription factor adaR n=1 Tax=Pseudocercospora fuligena TaxID=685502 RepID=A0A8H6RTD3_9PEZI|nr:C6 finger domain transcription factor adaR [Pseudocercospora fuligena]